MDGQHRWRVGELARATRVTVRALYHYERLGLLTPSARTGGGHRCYTDDDVRRLHVIVALRGFGLTLAQIRDTLGTARGDPVGLIRRQLAEADERIRQATRLRERLTTVLDALEHLRTPSTTDFIHLIEERITMSRPLTPEQLAAMSRRRTAFAASLTEEELAAMNRHRREATAALTPDQLAAMQAERARHRPVNGAAGPATGS
ncbi:MerR family transcriptional regulator [Actinoplanes sp. NPDC051851]|uniref:MerR family transcriptional regulator n=1 Tax=Actinoplanes sp. NPDC051851 TaxID=3154753 RepID=UPI003432085A